MADDAADLTHTEGTPGARTRSRRPPRPRAPTNRPVGQVEGDLMEPNNSGSGTSDVD